MVSTGLDLDSTSIARKFENDGARVLGGTHLSNSDGKRFT